MTKTMNCGHVRLFEAAGLPEGAYIQRDDCLLCEIERLRAALNEIAAWDEGPEVTSGFDEPGSAKAARKALRPSEPSAHQPTGNEHG